MSAGLPGPRRRSTFRDTDSQFVRLLRRPEERYPYNNRRTIGPGLEPPPRTTRWRRAMSSASQHSGRSAAVTGAGGGLGRDIALGLAAKGYVVFGTAVSPAEVQDLKDVSGGRVSLAVCDITKEQAVKAWAGGVSDALSDGGLDLLINNAGILTPGPLEVLPLDAIRHEFDVNVFGALSVMNAFLPALRKARGRIVQVSTWTASVPLPFNGPSGASKAAMEVFATVY